jgi:hypothetical protein
LFTSDLRSVGLGQFFAKMRTRHSDERCRNKHLPVINPPRILLSKTLAFCAAHDRIVSKARAARFVKSNNVNGVSDEGCVIQKNQSRTAEGT